MGRQAKTERKPCSIFWERTASISARPVFECTHLHARSYTGALTRARTRTEPASTNQCGDARDLAIDPVLPAALQDVDAFDTGDISRGRVFVFEDAHVVI